MKLSTLLLIILVAGCAQAQAPYDPRYPHAAPPPNEQVIRRGDRSTMSSTQGAWYASNCYGQAFIDVSGGRLTAQVVRDGPDDRWVVNVTEGVPGGAYAAVIRVAPAGSGSNAEMYTTPLTRFGGSERFRRALAERCR